MECKSIFVGSGCGNESVLESKVGKGVGAFSKTLLIGLATSFEYLRSRDVKEDGAIGDGCVMFCSTKGRIGGRRGLRSG